MNEFETRLKNIEQELLDLKTAGEYASIRTANITSSSTVSTGLYEITYSTNGEQVMAMMYKGQSGYCMLYPRTPSGNKQVVEINTTRWNNQTQSYDQFTNKLVVVSNVPVTSIERL